MGNKGPHLQTNFYSLIIVDDLGVYVFKFYEGQWFTFNSVFLEWEDEFHMYISDQIKSKTN